MRRRRSHGPAFLLYGFDATANVGQVRGCEAFDVHRGIGELPAPTSRRGE
jgi:hypothetical protein